MAAILDSKRMMNLDAPAKCRKCGETFFVPEDHRAKFGVTTKYVCTKCGDNMRAREVADVEKARLSLFEAEVKRDYYKTELEVEEKKLQGARQQIAQAEIEIRLKIDLAAKQTAVEAAKAEQEKQRTEQEKHKAECAKYAAERMKYKAERAQYKAERAMADAELEREKQDTEREMYKAKCALELEQEKQATEREKYKAAVECARYVAEQKKQQMEWEKFKAEAKHLKEQEKQKTKQEKYKAECAKQEAEQLKQKSGHENNSWAVCAQQKAPTERGRASHQHTANKIEKGTQIPYIKHPFKTI